MPSVRTYVAPTHGSLLFHPMPIPSSEICCPRVSSTCAPSSSLVASVGWSRRRRRLQQFLDRPAGRSDCPQNVRIARSLSALSLIRTCVRGLVARTLYTHACERANEQEPRRCLDCELGQFHSSVSSQSAHQISFVRPTVPLPHSPLCYMLLAWLAGIWRQFLRRWRRRA